ncbi:MAG: TetR/AcrR family transcriptional regulator [Bacteroidota bacterium]
MARPREFDIDQALEAATEAFWSRGYEATSMADLMQAMGLHKGSIYQAFGGKHALFMQALDRYLGAGLAQVQQALSDAGPVPDRLRAVLHGTLQDPAACQTARGCLGLNTLVELGPHDEVIAERVRTHYGRLREAFATCLAEGQRTGTIRTDTEADLLAEFLITTINGLQAGGKGYLSAVDQERVANVALDHLSPS